MATFLAVLAESSAAFAVNPKVTLVQGPTTSPPCQVTVRILVDPLGNTIDVSQFTIRYKSSCMASPVAALGTQAPASSTIESFDQGDTPSFPVCAQPACTSCSSDFDRHFVVNMAPPSGSNYSGTGDKEIAVVTFTAAAGASTCKVEWDQSVASGLQPTYLHLAPPTGDVFGPGITFVPNAAPPSCPGAAVVVPNPTLNGTVYYYAPTPLPNTNGVPNVVVCVQNPPAVPACSGNSQSNGSYSVAGVVPGSPTLSATKNQEPTDPHALGGGDVNTLLQILAGTITATADQKVAADVDLTGGNPTSVDLQKLRRYLVFDVAQCPDCAQWKFFCEPLVGGPALPCPITTPNCTNSTKNLKGILRGDVDGSWPGRFKATAPMTVLALDFGPVTWQGDSFVLPVGAEVRDVPLSSAIFTLSYDADAFEFVGAEPGALARSFDLTVNPAERGTLHGLLAGGREVVASSGEILSLRFSSRREAGGAISFSRLLLNDGEAVRVPEISVSRQGQVAALPTRFQIKAIPNPFNPSTSVEYTIPAGAGTVPVQVLAFDLAGRQVRELIQTEQGPGRYRVSWDGRDESGRALASGVYLLAIHAGSWTSTEKAVLLK